MVREIQDNDYTKVVELIEEMPMKEVVSALFAEGIGTVTGKKIQPLYLSMWLRARGYEMSDEAKAKKAASQLERLKKARGLRKSMQDRIYKLEVDLSKAKSESFNPPMFKSEITTTTKTPVPVPVSQEAKARFSLSDGIRDVMASSLPEAMKNQVVAALVKEYELSLK